MILAASAPLRLVGSSHQERALRAAELAARRSQEPPKPKLVSRSDIYVPVCLGMILTPDSRGQILSLTWLLLLLLLCSLGVVWQLVSNIGRMRPRCPEVEIRHERRRHDAALKPLLEEAEMIRSQARAQHKQVSVLRDSYAQCCFREFGKGRSMTGHIQTFNLRGWQVSDWLHQWAGEAKGQAAAVSLSFKAVNFQANDLGAPHGPAVQLAKCCKSMDGWHRTRTLSDLISLLETPCMFHQKLSPLSYVPLTPTPMAVNQVKGNIQPRPEPSPPAILSAPASVAYVGIDPHFAGECGRKLVRQCWCSCSIHIQNSL